LLPSVVTGIDLAFFWGPCVTMPSLDDAVHSPNEEGTQTDGNDGCTASLLSLEASVWVRHLHRIHSLPGERGVLIITMMNLPMALTIYQLLVVNVL
jgi:hypothetical protein